MELLIIDTVVSMAVAGKGKVVGLLLLLIIDQYGVLLVSSKCPEMKEEVEALERFYNSVMINPRVNWSVDSSGNWKGVVCDPNRYVMSLRLPAQSLIGEIPNNTIGSLTKLRNLSLRLNGLNGTIPSDFSNLVQLRNLNLDGNHFSGKFLDVILNITTLQNIDISTNNFSGNIPCKLQELPFLRLLRLENNNFTGHLPGLHIRPAVNFSVANNHFRGAVPDSLSHLGAEAFLGNPLLCDPPLSPCNYTFESHTSLREFCPSQPSLPNPPVATLAMSGGGALFLLLFLIILLFPVRRKQRPPTPTTLQTQSTTGSSTHDQTTTEMFIFPDNNPSTTGPSWAKGLDAAGLMSGSVVMEPPLAKGNNIGTSYKVELPLTDEVVLVKNLLDPDAVASDKRDFANKMDFLGNIKTHPNVMPLKGYCIHKQEYLLIYDFFPAGSLYRRLHKKEETEVALEWESRKRIALGAAKGLTHLHTVVKLVHGNIKSSNILLHPVFDSCVADFGLTATPPTSYYGPKTRRTRMECDVYAFGVLLMELLTGKSPDDDTKLPEWVQVQAGGDQIWDPKMANQNNNNSMEKQEMVCVLQIAKQCTHDVAGERPTMEKVARMIEDMQVSCRDEIEDAAGPAAEDHDIYEEEESLGHPGTPPPPPPAYTPIISSHACHLSITN